MPSAAIYDCEGPRPTAEERAFFRDTDPLGFILFADHCPTPQHVAELTDELRESVGREDVLVLIDQEGGRVARMRPPVFPPHPPMGVFGELWRLDPDKAREAARLNGLLLGRMTAALGVNVNCVPMLDVPQIDSDATVLGDRALAIHPDTVAELGRAVMDGVLAGGALPVIKHLPGHGRALVDSHAALPRVGASREDLRAVDFPPFRALNDAALGMTAHIVYEAYDPERCASLSPVVIDEVIRGEIGFDGLLFSDDLKMKALDGDFGDLAEQSLAAGCDAVLCCNFTMEEKKSVARKMPVMEGEALARAEVAFTALGRAAGSADRTALADDYAQLKTLLGPVHAV